jgi:hypothetical protein
MDLYNRSRKSKSELTADLNTDTTPPDLELEGNPEQTAVSETEILLNPEFKKMGIGVLDTGDKCYYEQLFVG